MRAATATVAALTVLAGCTVGSPVVSPTASASDPTPAAGTSEAPSTPTPGGTTAAWAVPRVGECRYIPDNSFLELANVSRITDCTDEHTAETVWVGEVTGALAEAQTPDYLAIATSVGCRARLTEHFGSTDWHVTRFVPAAFAAPLEQWRAGARWVRCDVYLTEHGEYGYDDGAALHAPVVLDAAALTALQVCLTFDPDEPDLAVTVDCSEPHGFERIAPTLDLAGRGDAFPGDDALYDEGEAYCGDVVTDYLGGSADALWPSWIQPDAEMWDAGERVIICGVEVAGGRVAGLLRGRADAVEVIPFADGEDDPSIEPSPPGGGDDV